MEEGWEIPAPGLIVSIKNYYVFIMFRKFWGLTPNACIKSRPGEVFREGNA